MTDDWVHLQVASGFSLQYGASTPDALIERVAEHGQRFAALTDRDGVYGAVRWALACSRAGIAPILGADLAIEPVHAVPSVASGRRTPARGGAFVDEGSARVVLLARGAQGWASLCRLISAAHQVRGRTVLSYEALGTHHAGVIALLGADSEVAQQLHSHGERAAARSLDQWREIFGSDLRIAVTSHRRRAGHRHSTAHAARLLAFAGQQQVRAVLTNAVRYRDSDQARVADVLDAARRLVPLTSAQVERDNGEAYLKSSIELDRIAHEIVRAAGSSAAALQYETMALAEQCALDPSGDLGIGGVFVPELEISLGGVAADHDADQLLRSRCLDAIPRLYSRESERVKAADRLEAELRTITEVGFAGYFITVAEVVALIRNRGVRVAARGSGAGSLVNHLLGISGVDPIRHGLLMERFLSPLRRELPDIDIDVESARREEIYDWILERFGEQRCACVSMMETYRVRHAIRDVGAALGMPPGEVGAFAKSFPHIRASKARAALADLPELRTSGFGRLAARGELDTFLSLVEGLDGLPRHVALHPCGVLLSDATLLDRTPVERSAAGFPMSQFDKDDVERMGLLKLDVLGVRMQSAMAHAISETERVTGEVIALDSDGLDDPATFELIRTTRTLGCFQIESPGQRELIGKFAPETFGDLIIDISLFRPGPVKSDMIHPFLRARQGWAEAQYLHDDLRPALEETYGVVVFHEQVLRILAVFTGCSLAEADETRRSMSSSEGLDDVRAWFYPAALRRGYRLTVVEQVWEVLRAFASFGFCKAHAAAFALPTYQSAWLKTHYPAAFYAGLLTHDPGMYPKRLILDDARHFGVEIHGLDVNESDDVYRLVVDDEGRQGIRLPLSDVKGISDDEVARLIDGRPYSSLADLWHRARISRPVAENLVVAGAFDSLYRFGGTQRRGALTRRDLLLQVADLERMGTGVSTAQLTFDLVDDPADLAPSGLPEMSAADRVRAEIDVLGMDVSHHVMEFYDDLLQSIGATHADSLLGCRSQQQVLIAGVKVAVQTPPVRSGRRVIFVTLDDSTGPVDATFFDDAQGDFAGTVFGSWVMLIRGVVRRTGPRGVSVRATGCWELGRVREIWRAGGAAAVWQMIDGDQPEVDTSHRRVLVHSSGYRQSPYADVRPAGGDVRKPSSALWHRSPGASE